jgi:hypothetical protein
MCHLYLPLGTQMRDRRRERDSVRTKPCHFPYHPRVLLPSPQPHGHSRNQNQASDHGRRTRISTLMRKTLLRFRGRIWRQQPAPRMA